MRGAKGRSGGPGKGLASAICRFGASCWKGHKDGCGAGRDAMEQVCVEQARAFWAPEVTPSPRDPQAFGEWKV